MSLNSATANLDFKSAIRLEDATQYIPWAKWAISLFVQARILADLPTSIPHYPLGGPATLAADLEWWTRSTKQETIKVLRDDAITRPQLRRELKCSPDETPQEKKAFAIRETAAMKDNAEAIAVYTKVYDLEFKRTMDFLKTETRRTIFASLKNSLGDHYLSALQVATYGDALSLFQEVHKFMPSDSQVRKAHLISKFWDSTFQREGSNDLAVWINYVTTAVHDLEQLGEATSDASKTSKLQTALPIEIFREFKIAHGSKAHKWDETVADLRVYAMIPEIADQLTQLSSSRSHRPEGSVFGAVATPKEPCRNFQRGLCTRDDCRYLHAGVALKPQAGPCKHCGRDGHPSEKCWGKFPNLRPARGGDGKKKLGNAKNAEVVMQIVQDAVDNGQTKVDLQALLKALKSDPAKVFGLTVRQQQQVQVEHVQEPVPDLFMMEDLHLHVRKWAREMQLQDQQQKEEDAQYELENPVPVVDMDEFYAEVNAELAELKSTRKQPVVEEDEFFAEEENGLKTPRLPASSSLEEDDTPPPTR